MSSDLYSNSASLSDKDTSTTAEENICGNEAVTHSYEYLSYLSIKNVLEKVEQLESLFSSRLSYDEGKERILDKLHAELQDYKLDLHAKLTRPIFYDIAVVLDDIRKTKIHRISINASEGVTLLESIEDSIIGVLDKYEILPFTSDLNTKYDASRQRMVKTTATTDSSCIGLISESISPGFECNDQVIYPEKVNVYKLEEK